MTLPHSRHTVRYFARVSALCLTGAGHALIGVWLLMQ